MLFENLVFRPQSQGCQIPHPATATATATAAVLQLTGADERLEADENAVVADCLEPCIAAQLL